MRIYQHSAKCPVAFRTFLDCNPSYWCFISLRWYEAEEENLNELRQSSGRTRCVMNIIQMGANCSHRVNFCLNNECSSKTSYLYRVVVDLIRESIYISFLSSLSVSSEFLLVNLLK